jgi:hypothetical protein
MSVAMATIISTLDIASLDIDEMRGEKVYWRVRAVLGLALLIAATACGGGSPTAPTPPGGRSSLAGEWSGGSSEAGANFVVSNEGRVTAITVNYTLNGCPVSRTLSGLSVEIGRTNPSFPAFGYSNSAPPIQANAIYVQGVFTPDGTVAGLTQFYDYMGCGSGSYNWSARRR